MSQGSPKSEPLRSLWWGSEILRVMYWLRGEGLGDVVDAATVERFLGLEAGEARSRLDRLASEGYVVADGEWYSLAPTVEGFDDVEFTTAFSDLLRPEPGACSDECWCQASQAEADACAGLLQIRRTPRSEEDPG